MFIKFRFYSFLIAAVFFFNFASANQAILLVSIEKSASVFIAHTLRKGLRKELIDISDEKSYPRVDIAEQRLHELVTKNGIAREHLRAFPENIEMLTQHKVKVVFHVRDLRQQVVSLAHYHLSLKQHPQIRAFYQSRHYDISNWDLNDFIQAAINTLPERIEMIQGWLDVYHQGKIPMIITTYEEFHDNPNQFLKRVLSFYGLYLNRFSNWHIPKNSYFNFRKGSKDEWKTALTIEQQQQIHQMIPEDFFNFFGWER